MTNRDYFWDILKNSHRRLLWNYFAIVNKNVYFGDGFWTDFWRIFLLITVLLQNWLHQCWWRILEMKCVSYNFKMLVTILVISVTNIHLRSTKSKPATNIREYSWQGLINLISFILVGIKVVAHCLFLQWNIDLT